MNFVEVIKVITEHVEYLVAGDKAPSPQLVSFFVKPLVGFVRKKNNALWMLFACA